MYVCRIQHKWRVEANQCIDKAVQYNYCLIHFPTPVDIKVGDEVIHTRPNACFLSAPKQPRWFYFPEETRVNWLHAYPEIGPLLEEASVPLGCVFYPEEPGEVTDLFQKIARECRTDHPFREQMIDAYMRVLILMLARTAQEAGSTGALGDMDRKEIETLRGEMLACPERKWTVDQMAKAVSLSPSRFHTVYKRMFGISPIKDVILGKIDYAKALLIMNEKMPVAVVAERLGYSNTFHFIRQFRDVTGITPNAYRKKMQ